MRSQIQFLVQSYIANLFYYEPGPGKMERLIVPTGDPKNIQTIAEVSKQLFLL